MARMRWVIAIVMGLLLMTAANGAFAQDDKTSENRAGVGDPARLPESSLLPQKRAQQKTSINTAEVALPALDAHARYLIVQPVLEMMKVGITNKGLGWSVEW